MKLASIIKYEGDNRTFVWKHPEEDFNTKSQLIVHESQEAVFFANGQALDLFGAGEYSLTTKNLPIIGKIQRIPTDGESPFHCEVYFVNKTTQMAIKWGTDSKVDYIEPQYGFPLRIGASGDMSLRVEDSRKLLIKLVGTERDLSQDALVSYFRGILMTNVKTYIAQVMRENRINIFQIDELLADFSKTLRNRLYNDFLDYGVSLERFNVTTIVKPDGDPTYERFKRIFFEESIGIREERLAQQRAFIQQQTEAQRVITESAAIAQKRKQEGYTYQQERGYAVAEKLAQNEGVGNFSSAGIGLGMMAGMGGGVGATVAGLTSQAMEPIMGSFNQQYAYSSQPNIFTAPPEISFKEAAPEVQPAPAQADPSADFRKRVDDAKYMLDAGMLTDEEFQELKKELLNRFREGLNK